MGLNTLKYGGIVFWVMGLMMATLFGGDILFASADTSKQSEIVIIIKEINLVNNEHILLGDISEIKANGFLKEALAKIQIGTSPKPDQIKSLDKRKVFSAVRSQKYLPEDISIHSPERIYVKRLAQNISTADIRQFINQHLTQKYKGREYKIVSLNIRGLEPYPQGPVFFQLMSNDIIDKNGRMSAFLEVMIDGKPQDKLSISGQVDVYENILCVNKSFVKGDVLKPEDVVFQKRNIFDLSDDVIKKYGELERKALKSSLKKGDYLRAKCFEDIPLVKKGDIIRLLSRNQNLLIVTSAISMEDGFADKVIKVENLNSGKLVRGIVKGKATVEAVY